MKTPRIRFRWLVALAWASIGLANAADPPRSGASIRVDVSLSKAAAAKLAATHEAIGVSASFSGEPTAAGRSAAAEDGQIGFGMVEQSLAKAGRVRLAPPAFDPARLALITQPEPRVNINVYSARKALPNNVLECDLFEGSLRTALRKPIAVRCKLIGERTPAPRARD